MDQNVKVRENRLRRMAERQGYKLVKNPRRDARATDYGSYMLVSADNPEELVADFGWAYPGWDKPGNSHLDDVEEWLSRPHRQSPP